MKRICLGRIFGCGALAGIVLASVFGLVDDARGESVAQVLTAKRIAPSTVALIDPESGTSSGGATGTDVNYAVGDILTFIVQFTAVSSNNALRGFGGYITEYVPPNTRVVGVRLIDREGHTLRPHRAALAPDGYGVAPKNRFTDFGLQDGSIAQLYADTGIFYSEDPLTARNPADQIITVANGWKMGQGDANVVGEFPVRAQIFDEILGIAGGPYYIHNRWDWLQVQAFGSSGQTNPPYGGDVNPWGTGFTPHFFGSAVAGPDTWYSHEAVDDAPTSNRALPGGPPPPDTAGEGPWVRIAYPGSETGTGSYGATIGVDTRVGVPTTAGVDVSPSSPLPAATNAVRFSVGQLRVGEEYLAEIALRVMDSPLDPNVGGGLDLNCGEVFGGAASRDNPWAFALPSPNCVVLNLLFEIEVDHINVPAGQPVTFTIRGKNLSVNTRTNVVVTDTLNASDMTVTSISHGGTQVGDVITWPTISSWAPSDEFEYTVTGTITGVGQGSTFNRAKIVYDQLPQGFVTQALVNRYSLALIDFDLVANPLEVGTGGTFQYTATFTNSGNGAANQCSSCEYIVKLPDGFTVNDGTSVFNGTSVGDPTLVSGTTSTYSWAATTPTFAVPAGESRTLTFQVQVPSVSPDVYTSCLEAQLSSEDLGIFNDTECHIGPIAVGAARTDTPTLFAPILTSNTCISGFAEPTATVTIYINGIARDTVTAGAEGYFESCGWGTSLPELVGGQEVTATAWLLPKHPSEFSDPVFVTTLPQCSDGVDNDEDGETDYPADSGCDSPLDQSEGDPPPPECSDGQDNDGDGQTDYPNDPDCVNAADRAEATFPACSDGVDNDGDSDVDFPADPGCRSAIDTNETDPTITETEIKPRLLLIFDTSGSMNWDTCGEEGECSDPRESFTGGDGTLECPGSDVACVDCGGTTSTTCGNALPDDSRIAKVKKGISDAVKAYGSVDYALMRFRQRAIPFACPTRENPSYGSGGWQGAIAQTTSEPISPPCDPPRTRQVPIADACGSFGAGELLVRFDPNNAQDMLAYMDNQSNYSGPGDVPPGLDIELRGTGSTPLAGSLTSARQYLEALRDADPKGPCRPYRVILITDGDESCGQNAPGAAAALAGLSPSIPVHVVGFASNGVAVDGTPISTKLNAIASSGGTGTAIFVDDSDELAIEISKIISLTLLRERCNNADDDCDGLCDETFPEVRVLAQNGCTPRAGAVCFAGVGKCRQQGEFVCTGDFTTGCNATPGPPDPSETCGNLIDDDCDGEIDEGCENCPAQPDICDGIDNDCDGQFDEDFVPGPCGTDVGQCEFGTSVCDNGVVTCPDKVGPFEEICDGIDNDCDTIIDTFSRVCYGANEPPFPYQTGQGCESDGTCYGICRVGVQICTAGNWSDCAGDIVPRPEECNGLDDDCDTQIDEGVSSTCTNWTTCATYPSCGTCPPDPGEICDGLDNNCNGQADEPPVAGVGDPCGIARGECERGTLVCDGVNGLICQGGTDPVPEVCDGLDNNCNGQIDDGVLGDPCGTDEGECRAGIERCIGGQPVCVGEIQPVGEVCDGKDNNCDGQIDNGVPSVACGSDVGECTPGNTVCVDGETECQNAVGPSPEICDGLDNNCNGVADDNPIDVGVPCGDSEGECKQGVVRCLSTGPECIGGVGPQEEVCDGRDNDCDGEVDEEIAGAGDPCGDDTGACRSGVRACQNVPGTGWVMVCVGAIGPTTEICDGLDNDCDNEVDESYPEEGKRCSSDIGECKAGFYNCTEAGELICEGGTEPTDEVCDGLDNDCNGAIDDNLPGDGEPCGLEAGATSGDCKAGQAKCVGGEWICVGAVGPLEEICNGKDDDCDGEIDEEAQCPGDSVCIEGQCVVPCREGEFTCPGGTVCINGYCIPDKCADVSCQPTERCFDGDCIEKCTGVTCEDNEVCKPETGQCVDNSCLSLGCPEGQKCVNFACVDDPCKPGTCPADKQCSNGQCLDTCLNVECQQGQVCIQGKCVTDRCETLNPPCPSTFICKIVDGEPKCEPDPCRVITCPEDQVCLDAQCVDDPCVVTSCPAGLRCKLTIGGQPNCERIEGQVPLTTNVVATGAGGCSCEVSGTEPTELFWSLLGLLGWVLVRRRRTR